MTAPTWWTDSGWSTAHLLRADGVGALTVCGRVMRQPVAAGLGLRRCHYCATSPVPGANGDADSSPVGGPPSDERPDSDPQ